jgi:asparagine synthase (glutamine-hydrolysing)
MCGITGILSRSGKPISKPLVLAMMDLLKHRGPDGQGMFINDHCALGHRRLSIIDLEKGQQPITNENGSVIVVFNGEIYNYLELRQELIKSGHQFRTSSDTEVIVHLYEEKGKDLFSCLNGMFAVAIFDLQNKELTLARDRIGKKPLFYYCDRDWVVFGSELKAVAAHPAVEREVDRLSVYDYLSLNYIPGQRTILKSVSRVPPGSWVSFDQKDLKVNKYWSVDRFFREPRIGLEENKAIDELDQLLTDAVRIRLRSDVPIGIFLSGGIDSSLVALKAKELGADLCGFNADFREKSFSETHYAREAAGKIGMELKIFQIDPQAGLNFQELVNHADDPLADSSCVPYYLLSQAASKHVKVVLGGDGGDELFAGYLTYPATLLAAGIKSRFPGMALNLADRLVRMLPVSERKVSFEYKLKRFFDGLLMPPGMAHFSWNGAWSEKKKRELFYSADLLAPEAGIKGTYEHLAAKYKIDLFRPRLSSLQIADHSEYLVNDILVKVDRMSMAHGLEVRSPLLDYRIIEWAAQLPAGLKMKNNRIGKYLLKRYAARNFSSRTVYRPKQGFSIPVHDWIRGVLRPMAEDLLSPESIKRSGFLSPSGVRNVFKEHLDRRKQYGFELWGLMVLVMWHRIFREPQAGSLS